MSCESVENSLIFCDKSAGVGIASFDQAGMGSRVVNLGPVMLNFISISIFKKFFNENLNLINNSFKIKYCSFKARFVKPGIYNPDGFSLTR